MGARKGLPSYLEYIHLFCYNVNMFRSQKTLTLLQKKSILALFLVTIVLITGCVSEDEEEETTKTSTSKEEEAAPIEVTYNRAYSIEEGVCTFYFNPEAFDTSSLFADKALSSIKNTQKLTNLELLSRYCRIYLTCLSNNWTLKQAEDAVRAKYELTYSPTNSSYKMAFSFSSIKEVAAYLGGDTFAFEVLNLTSNTTIGYNYSKLLSKYKESFTSDMVETYQNTPFIIKECNTYLLTNTDKTPDISTSSEDYLFIMYLCAQDTPEENSTLQESLYNDSLRQLESVMREIKTSEYGKIKVLALYGDKDEIFIKEFSKDAVKYTPDFLTYQYGSKKGFPRNMGNARLLEEFLTWVHARYDYKNTILCLNDHGMGLFYETDTYKTLPRVLCITDGYEDGPSYITCADIKDALEASGYSGEKKPLLLWEDCCLQANVEIVYDLRGGADYYLSSSNLSYAFNYENIIKLFTKRSNIQDIGRAIVDEYIEEMKDYGSMAKDYEAEETGGVYHFTQTFCHLGGNERDKTLLEDLKGAVNLLSHSILNDNDGATLIKIRKSIYTTKIGEEGAGLTYNNYPMYLKDLGIMAKEIWNMAEVNAKTKTYAQDIVDKLHEIIVYSRAYRGDEAYYYDENGRLRAKYIGREDKTFSDNLVFGLTISFYNKDYEENLNDCYSDMSSFGKENYWSDLLSKFYGNKSIY